MGRLDGHQAKWLRLLKPFWNSMGLEKIIFTRTSLRELFVKDQKELVAKTLEVCMMGVGGWA